MYFTEDIIYDILKNCGFEKNVEIYVSSGGKSSGEMWEKLKSNIKLNFHIGDNYHSDVKMAEKKME